MKVRLSREICSYFAQLFLCKLSITELTNRTNRYRTSLPIQGVSQSRKIVYKLTPNLQLLLNNADLNFHVNKLNITLIKLNQRN